MIAAIRNLYAMVRGRQEWCLDEPIRDDTGQAVVHDIVAKLGCNRLVSGSVSIPQFLGVLAADDVP